MMHDESYRPNAIMMLVPIMSHVELRNRVCWTTREIARSPIQPISAQRAQCVRETSTGFGPRTNAATRHSDQRRRRLTRWPMDRSPNPKTKKVDRAIELRGRGAATLRLRAFGHTVDHPPSVTHTQRQRPASVGASQPLTRVHTHCARRQPVAFKRSALTPAAPTRKVTAGVCGRNCGAAHPPATRHRAADTR